MNEPPEPAVVEWGSERRGPLDRLVDTRGWHPAIPWVLAGLAAVALFGSLVGEWQVVGQRSVELEGESVESESFGLGLMLVWGISWLVGATLLGVCVVQALAGQPPVRRYARSVGLALAAMQSGILVGAAANLNQETIFDAGIDVELSLGRGLYSAFACVLLVGAALYLARTGPVTRQRPATEPATAEPVDGPADLAVGPAEPMSRPTDTLQG